MLTRGEGKITSEEGELSRAEGRLTGNQWEGRLTGKGGLTREDPW